ncbi:hypothetical protein [Nocardia wallacei]|uniref:hypothetical protein n=1 Tax=Nocardia wallacei TaxID=480035 RepID=UPI0024589C55|nr:hypothetical protein [Nocardia wallacei]
MTNVPFTLSCYWPGRDTRAVRCGVLVVVLVVVVASAAGYGELVLEALITTIVGTAAAAVVGAILRAWPYRA